MMFADMSPGEIWMVCLTAATVVIMAVGTFIKKTDVKVQQPLDVQLVESFVSKSDFNAHVAAVSLGMHQMREILRTEIPQMERRIMESGEHRVTKLHDRINDVLAEVSRVEGVIEQALKK